MPSLFQVALIVILILIIVYMIPDRSNEKCNPVFGLLVKFSKFVRSYTDPYVTFKPLRRMPKCEENDSDTDTDTDSDSDSDDEKESFGEDITVGVGPAGSLNTNSNINLDDLDVEFSKNMNEQDKNASIVNRHAKHNIGGYDVDSTPDYEGMFKPFTNTNNEPHAAALGIDEIQGMNIQSSNFSNFANNVLRGVSQKKAHASYVNRSSLRDVYGPELESHENLMMGTLR